MTRTMTFSKSIQRSRMHFTRAFQALTNPIWFLQSLGLTLTNVALAKPNWRLEVQFDSLKVNWTVFKPNWNQSANSLTYYGAYEMTAPSQKPFPIETPHTDSRSTGMYDVATLNITASITEATQTQPTDHGKDEKGVAGDHCFSNWKL